MLNRAGRRAQKCQPKIYTESDLRKAISDAITEIARHNLQITIAACALVAHREFGFGKQRLGRLIENINTISFDTLNVGELQKQLKEETGVDLKFYEDSVTTGLL
jgi:hypothetical protein